MSRERDSLASFFGFFFQPCSYPCIARASTRCCDAAICAQSRAGYCYDASICQRLAVDAASKKNEKGPEPTPPGSTPDRSRHDHFVNILAKNGVELIIW